MFILDSLLIGGIKFVLDKVANTVDAELNDENRLREELLAAHMRLELGEISEEDFSSLEADLLKRMREIRERAKAAAGEDAPAGGAARVVGIESIESPASGEEPDRS